MTDEKSDEEEVEKPEDAPDGFGMTALSDGTEGSDGDSEKDTDE